MYLQEGWHRGLGLFSQIIPSVREACPIFALETDFFPLYHKCEFFGDSRITFWIYMIKVKDFPSGVSVPL